MKNIKSSNLTLLLLKSYHCASLRQAGGVAPRGVLLHAGDAAGDQLLPPVRGRQDVQHLCRLHAGRPGSTPGTRLPFRGGLGIAVCPLLHRTRV